MTKETELAHHIHNLKMMVKLADDPKLLWEEMQILGKKAFKLQEKMDNLLNELEESTTEITAIQMLSDTREMMWDLMNQLATRELELKNKPHPKNCTQEHHCCCHEHSEKHHCCCHDHKKGQCCQKKKCTTKGKKKCPKK